MAVTAKGKGLALSHRTIAAALTAMAERFGELPMVVDGTGSTSFRTMASRSERIARGLLGAGMAKGARIGVLVGNNASFLAAFFAITRAGGVAVLISTLVKPPELAHLIRNADLDMLIAADRYLGHDYVAAMETALPGLADAKGASRLALTTAPFLRAIWVWGEAKPAWSAGDEAALVAAADRGGIDSTIGQAAEQEVVEADPSVILYTSGSSAEPKAIVHSHANVVRQGEALSELMLCEPGDQLLTTMPFCWVGGLFTGVFAAAFSGAAVVCPDGPSIDSTIAAIGYSAVTHITHWPQQIELMKDRPEFAAAFQKMRPAFAHQFALFGLAAPERTANTLGMSETLGPHSMLEPRSLTEREVGSFGTAVGGIERRIIDPLTGAELPAGTPGILALRGGALMIGMHRKAAAEVFDAAGFYRTDDVCTLDADGHLYFRGRANDLIKASGANVSPLEVEAALLAQPGVKMVCVVGLPDSPSNELLVAAVVPEDGVELAEDSLRAALKAQLSSYKVPRRFVFLGLDELPMTASAKIYRTALKRLLAERLAA